MTQQSGRPQTQYQPLTEEETIQRAKAVVQIEIEALQQIKAQIGSTFVQAIELLENPTGRVIVTGMGKSGLIGKKMAATFSSTGTPAFFLHPAEGSHGDLGALMPQDVLIAISNSGETPEILSILPLVKRFNIPLISMTGNAQSSLARKSDVVLDIKIPQEACPMGLAPTASTTATLALGDALAVVLLERKGFTETDFAVFHPAGALGKRLLLKVEDVMHTGAELPRVTINTSFMDALMEMTSKKLGMTLVVNETGSLEGILTDGDIRRALTQYDNVQMAALKDIMTRSPKTIEADDLAFNALCCMEESKITTLVVLNADTQPFGVVHLHDLLQMGM